ncbi:hypothetical protein GC197_12300 [bacterium]|nr:hypothetical protein [bacterium]
MFTKALLVVPVLLVGLLAEQAYAQNVFLRRGNMAADALSLEHKVKKLAANNIQMQTLAAALKDLANESQKFTRLAQRQGSYFALQRAFDPVIQRYKVVEYTIENASDWNQGDPRMQDWRFLQNAFDQTYYDLYGYDLLDPYFGRHPDYAAVPIQPQIPMRVLHPERPAWTGGNAITIPIRVPNPVNEQPPIAPPSQIQWQTQGSPRQF